MIHNRTKTLCCRRRASAWRIAIIIGLLSLVSARAITLSLSNQGYLFLHPFFKARPWLGSLDRLSLTLPDTLSTMNPVGFDVAQGRDSAMTLLSLPSGELYSMPSMYRKVTSPCYDFTLDFGDPVKVARGAFALPADRHFYIVKDSLYSYDSIRVVTVSATTPLRLYIATIKYGSASVSKLDSITLASRRAGQGVVTVSGDPDSVTGVDRGLWVTGGGGLIRYIPYVNRVFGTVAVRDLGDASVVLHSNGTYAGTMAGNILHRNAADTFFTLQTTAPSPVWRVYNQGAVGDNGLFMEKTTSKWSSPFTVDASNYRYANFIKAPGGFRVELLDSAWAYNAFTYRDSTSLIVSTVPASLLDSIKKNSFVYNPSSGALQLTINLSDPDSNFSDYKLSILPYGKPSINLKSDGKYTISPIPDSVTCAIGYLKMNTGTVVLTLSDTAVKVVHSCVLGTLNPTCLTCYWKKYDFSFSQRWEKNDALRMETGSQLLKIIRSDGLVTALFQHSALKPEFLVVNAPGLHTLHIPLPLKTGIAPVQIIAYNLEGRQLSSAVITNSIRSVNLSAIPQNNLIIICCRMNDGTLIRQAFPIVK